MMRRIALFLFLYLGILSAFESHGAAWSVEAKGGVKDMVLRQGHLIWGTDRGILQDYDLKQKQIVREYTLPKIKDFMGDLMPAKIAAVDWDEGRYLILSDSGQGGFSDLRIVEGNTTRWILKAEDRKPLVKARFIDKDHVLLGYLSDEAALLDLTSGKEVYRLQVDESKFSDFALNEDRTIAAFGGESGIVTLLETVTGKIVKRLSGVNKDNLYMVDIKGDYVAAAGQDRRAAWYDWKRGNQGFFPAKFFVYAAALSPRGKRAAYSMDEQSNLTLFDLESKEKIALLKGHSAIVNALIFADLHTLYSGGDDGKVLGWKINQ